MCNTRRCKCVIAVNFLLLCVSVECKDAFGFITHVQYLMLHILKWENTGDTDAARTVTKLRATQCNVGELTNFLRICFYIV